MTNFMERDYTKAHPQAIFQEIPTHIIEIWKGNYVKTPAPVLVEIDYINSSLESTKICDFTTIALFIIKPKRHD